MKYDPNPKHKKPWQRGRKGSLCPDEIYESDAATMLQESELDGQKRYATHDGKAFCAQMHRNPLDDEALWHGYPVGWKEVPEKIRREWCSAGKVKRRQIKQFWDHH